MASFRHMRSLIITISLFTIFLLVQTAAGQSGYVTYYNSRFEYSIKYPVKVLVPQEEAENGDGRVFLAKAGAEMRVWGQYNALMETLKSAYENDIDDYGRGVTYKILQSNGYVISGTKGNKVYYQKTILNGDDGDGGAVFATFTIEYKKAEKAKYDGIVTKIAASFKFD